MRVVEEGVRFGGDSAGCRSGSWGRTRLREGRSDSRRLRRGKGRKVSRAARYRVQKGRTARAPAIPKLTLLRLNGGGRSSGSEEGNVALL